MRGSIVDVSAVAVVKTPGRPTQTLSRPIGAEHVLDRGSTLQCDLKLQDKELAYRIVFHIPMRSPFHLELTDDTGGGQPPSDLLLAIAGRLSTPPGPHHSTSIAWLHGAEDSDIPFLPVSHVTRAPCCRLNDPVLGFSK